MRHAWLWLLCGFVFGMVLYLPLGSIQYDLNGIAEAKAVESGGNDIFHPNHMLYGVIGRLIYAAAQSIGYTGTSGPILKVMTALAGAATIGVALLAFRRLSDTPAIAVLASVFLAASWSQWSFSTDIHYVPLAAAFCASALFAVLRSPRPVAAAVTGLLCALAILTWQACVFLMPVLALGPLILHKSHPLRERMIAALIIACISAMTLSLLYLAVALFVHNYRSPSEIIGWLTNYGGTRLPVWGKWSPDRFMPAGISAIASIIPLWSGLGLRDLLRGSLRVDKLPALLSLLGLLMLAGTSIWRVSRGSQSLNTKYGLIIWLIAAYAIFLPFIVWWDPFEPKWFVVPNLFLASALAAIWGSRETSRITMVLFGTSVVLIGFGTLQATIWPRAVTPNPSIEKAACVARHMDSTDLLLETDWSWGGYVSYFYGRDTVSLIDLSGRAQSADALLATLTMMVRERQEAGGRVFIEDIDSYPLSQQEWLATHAGLSLAAFDSFDQQPAFRCNGCTIEQLILKDTR